MQVFDKLKGGLNKFVNVTDADYEDFDEQEEETPVKEEKKQYFSREWNSDSDYSTQKSKIFKTEKAEKKANVVPIESRNVGSRTIGDSQVVVKKITGVSEVGSAADILKQGKIVVINTEDCPVDTVQRVIDILYGVTYALDGSFKPIADKAFVLTPYNVSVTSEDYSELGDTDNY